MSLLASVRPAAGTETTIYTVPSGKKAVVNVLIVNTTPSSGSVVDFGVAATNTSLSATNFWLNDLDLLPNQPVQFTGVALTSGNTIRGLSQLGNVNFIVNGIEESI